MKPRLAKNATVHFTLLIFFALLLVACGGGDESEAPPTDVPATPVAEQPEQVEPTPEVVAEPGTTAVSTLQDVKTATVQIVAQGSFADPEVGTRYNVAGSGSGFIIDPSGLAVTNNHVVTGAAFIEVYVGGESEPRNARVLGVSECSDLAVIDIEGEDFAYLEWFDGTVDVGLDVYTAGFPLGDPEYTLTRGIISKAQAGGDTNWASVDSVLEHDATINPGNSGGPLVDANGRLVGINYAGNSSTNQYFAIAQAEALSVIEQLRNEQNVHSIGINGTAVSNGEGLSGIWVSSVESGSPADNAGVQPGDIVLSLEGLILGTDGTMADYCDILRGRNATDVMSIEILRFSSQEVLEGQLNGTALMQSFSFADSMGDDVAEANESAAYTYTTVTDDSGLLQVEVPTVWMERDGSPWQAGDETIGLRVVSSTSIDAFWNTWNTSGVIFAASGELVNEYNENTLLDEFDYSEFCSYDGRYDYEDPLYTGYFDVWSNCGGEGSLYLTLSVTPESRDYIIFLGALAYTDADLEALDHILDSFLVDV